jgi:ADP-ribose pyrophosphatase YjhB (NUDIX family)
VIDALVQQLPAKLINLPHRLWRLYWKIRKPRSLGVKALLTNPSGEILLVQTSYETYWALPGGGVDKYEHPADAIVRELREETRLDSSLIRSMQIGGIYTSAAQGKSDTIILYEIAVTGGGEVKPHAEVSAAGFFAPDDLPPGTSPATRRRIDESRNRIERSKQWRGES